MDANLDLAELFRIHEVRVYTYFRRMLPPGSDAVRDLAQETFYRAFRDAHKFRGEAAVSTWLLGIARNVFLEWWRSQRRERPQGDSDVQEVAPAADARDIDVERALRLLEPDHREVLVLRFALDLPGEEVAAILGITHEAVRQRVARAKRSSRRRGSSDQRV